MSSCHRYGEPAMTLSQPVAEATTSSPTFTDSIPTGPAEGSVEERVPAPDLRRRRTVGMAIWGALFLVAWLTIGIPTDPVEAFLWIWAATIAWNNDKPWRSHFRFVRDWAAVIVLLVIYNISRGWASTVKPHVTPMIHVDEKMWGWLTGGRIPTIWLQQHLYDKHHVRWFEVVASFTYFSHFVMALIVAAVLWMRNRSRWAAFIRRWFTLTALGLATYFLYPAAPPWWAAKHHYLHKIHGHNPVARLSTRGWDAIGLHHAGSLLTEAQVQGANQVAAMPSLHSAYALCVVAFFLPTVRKRWWPLLLCYPLLMTFALVYSGEHYVTDVLAGWAYVVFTYVAVGLAEKAWAAWKRRRDAATTMPPVAPEPIGDVVLEPAPSDAVACASAGGVTTLVRQRESVAQEAPGVEKV
jgi:hypothetical protein